MCLHLNWMIFSKWVSDNEKDELEIFYRLLDDEHVLCNDDVEFGANNERVMTATN